MERQRHQNNFDLLRLILSSLVVLGHFNVLTGGGRQSVWFHLHGFAVEAFFVISGYLVTASYEKPSGLVSYLVRRTLRIYPLYAMVIVMQTIFMLGLLGANSIVTFGNEAIEYLSVNLMFLNFLKPQIALIFDGIAIHAVNPSLWTLKIEYAFYIFLPIFVLCRHKWGLFTLAVFVGLSILYFYLMAGYDDGRLAKQIPGQIRFFILGMLLYYLREYFTSLRRWGIFITLSSFGLCIETGPLMLGPIFYPIIVAIFVFSAATLTPPIRLPLDISYGVYLIHAPVIQFLLVLTGIENTFEYLILSMILIVPLATVAAVAIERPCIALGGKVANAIDRRDHQAAGAP